MAEAKAPLEGKLYSQHDKVAKRSFPAFLPKKGTAAPTKGATITIAPGNGFEYTGKVTDVTEAGGEALVEFADGLKLVPAK